MANTTFVDKSTVIQADWLNEINGFFYNLFAGATTVEDARLALGIVNPKVVNENTIARTLVSSDADSYIVTSQASAVIITIPNGIFTAPVSIVIAQSGSGQVSIAASPGVTIRSATGNYTTRAQYSVIGLVMLSANTWFLTGDLT